MANITLFAQEINQLSKKLIWGADKRLSLGQKPFFCKGAVCCSTELRTNITEVVFVLIIDAIEMM